MVFKRGVTMLAMAAVLAVASTSAEQLKVETNLKHPVVKEVKRTHDGKVNIVLDEGAVVHKKHKDVKKHDDKKQKHVKKTVVYKSKDDKHKKHAKKSVKEVHEEKKDNGEVIRKYAHGNVRIMANNQPAQKKAKKEVKHAKKVEAKKVEAKKVKKHTKEDDEYEDDSVEDSYEDKVVKKSKKEVKHAKKTVAKKSKKHTKDEIVEVPADVPVEEPTDDSYDETNLTLGAGESVSLDFAQEDIKLTVAQNGSLILRIGDETHVLEADDVEIDFEGDFVPDWASSSSHSGSGSHAHGATVGQESLLQEVEEDISGVAKKFTELATKLTGNNKYFSKGTAPVVFVCAILGALATVVGVAAIAVGRARDNTAAADPASVLGEETVDDVDVEANVTAEVEEEDAAADETESLDDSSSSDEEENEDEEGKFTNEASV